MNMLISIIGLYLVFALIGFAIVKLLKLDEFEFYKKQLAILKVNINFVIAVSLFMFVSHFFAFILQSYKSSIVVSLILILVAVLILSFIKIKSFSFQKDFKITNPFTNSIYLLLAIYLAFNAFMKDSFYSGSWDRILHAYNAAVLENNFYPPRSFNNIDVSLDNYHYGTSLFSSMIQFFTGTEVVDAMSLCLVLTTISSLFLLASLFAVFSVPHYANLALCLFVFYFTSYNSFEFIITQFHKFKSSFASGRILDFLSGTTAMSVKSLGRRLSYYGWAIGYNFMFATILFMIAYFKENKSKLLLGLLFFTSFALYFTYPPFWYPILVGALGFLAFEFLFNTSLLKEKFITGIQFLVVFFISKFLTFTHSMTTEEGLNFMKFKPQLKTSMWPNLYWGLVEKPEVIKAWTKKFHFYGEKFFIEVPFFSNIIFREFGLILLISLLIGAYLIFKKEIEAYLSFLFAGIFAIALPYLFEYSIRPIETARFFVVGKGFLLIFIACFLIRFLKKQNLQKILLVTLLLVLALPEFNAMRVLGRPLPKESRMPLFDAATKQFIKEARRIHKSGDIALEDTFLLSLPQESSYAGFFSTQGEYMRLPNTTRKTALKTLNPFLLKDMRVDYLFIKKNSKDVDLQSPRFRDTELFTLIKDFKADRYAFKFNKNFDEKKYEDLRLEYIWLLAYENEKTFTPVQFAEKFVASPDKESILKMREQVKGQLVQTKGPEYFVWTKPRAVPNPKFKAKP
jgi:hypothetical protein